MRRALVVLVALTACKGTTTPTRPSVVPVGTIITAQAAPAIPGLCAPPNEAEALAPEDAADKAIRGVCVHGELGKVNKEDVLAYLREKPGDTFQPERLAGDVRALYDSGFFRSITVTSRAAGTGIELHFELVVLPEIHAFTIESGAHIPVSGGLFSKQGEIFSKVSLNRRLTQLRELYATEGFAEATVEARVDPETPAGVDIHVTVNEGPRTTVGALTIKGASRPFEVAIRKLADFAPGAPVGRSALNAARESVEHLYGDRAYYALTTIEAGSRAANRTAPVTLTVIESGPHRVGKVEVTIDPDLDRDLAKVVRLKTGDPADRARILADFARVVEAFRARGRSENLGVSFSPNVGRPGMDVTFLIDAEP